MPDDTIFDLIPRAADRLVARMAAGPWPQAGPRHLEWSANEIALHVPTIVDYFDAMLTGGSPVASLSSLTDTNANGLAEREELPWPDVVDIVRAGSRRIANGLRAHDADRDLSWHGNIGISPRTAAGVFAGELLVHEWDLAWTLRRRPGLTAADASLVLSEVRDVIPHVVDPDAAEGRRVHLRVHLRGGDTFDLRLADGTLSVTPPEGRAHCHVNAHPTAFLLLAYKRRPTWRVAATASAVAYGWRPWQAFTLPRLLDVP